MRQYSPRGFLYAALAFSAWGIFPLYWKPLARVPPWETVSHRVVWSLVVLALFVKFAKQGGEVLAAIKTPRRAAALLLTASLLSSNWLLFIYGVISGQVVQTSLGYFLNPLMNILLACAVLKERLTRPQVVAVALAGCGVLVFGWNLGRVPWIAIGLASSFGLYGLIRKIIAVQPLPGLLVETAWMAPAAIAVLVGARAGGSQFFGPTPAIAALLLGAGVVTTMPLLWFNGAAKLLPLSTMGFLQFLTPTLQLACGVAIFREPFSSREAVAFGFIWAAIAIYVATVLRSRKTAIVAPNPD